nr:MAG TPA: repressor protein [Caudoviricetes sp.]
MFNVEHILSLLDKRGYSCSKVEKSLGFGNGAIRRWKQSSPSIDKLYKLSNFLNISIIELLGEYTDLSSDEQKLIEIYNGISDDDKILLMAYGLQLQRNMPILNVVNKPTKQDTEEELRVVARGEGLTTIKANTSDIDDDIKRHIHKDKI